MSTKSALAELRRKKQCIERAIRALEQVQKMEKGAPEEEATRPERRTGTSNVVVMGGRPRRS